MIAIKELNKETSTFPQWCAAITEFVVKKGTCDVPEGDCYTQIGLAPWEQWYNDGKTIEEAFIIDGGYEKDLKMLKKIKKEALDGKPFMRKK